MVRAMAIMDPAVFRECAAAWRRDWPVPLAVTGPDGTLERAMAGLVGRRDPACQTARRLAVHEAVRWGEPTVVPCPGERLLWAVPLMINARTIGGLVAEAPEQLAIGTRGRRPRLDIRAACQALHQLAEDRNLTNAALLAVRRSDMLHEADRARAIHEFKGMAYASVHEAYLHEEPALVAAIRRGDAIAARAVLNRLLVVIYHRGSGKLRVIKSFLMELVVTMLRAALETGGVNDALMAANHAALVEVAGINDEEELARWVARTLNSIMAVVGKRHSRPDPDGMDAAMRWLEAHCTEKITRDDGARSCNLSPSHFSRRFAERFGRPFNEVLNRLRVQRAAELLARSDRSLLDVALSCGFQDQSYFTKVFRRHTSQLPRAYRARERKRAER
jgi:AraC-like DNA-binding protein